MKNIVMKIDGVIVAVLVQPPSLSNDAFDEIATALLLTLANQTGKQIIKEESTN
jgi:hypothetical protein